MLNAPADWRWGQSDNKTFLYDQMKLLRCADPGDWSEVLQKVDVEVCDWLSLAHSKVISKSRQCCYTNNCFQIFFYPSCLTQRFRAMHRFIGQHG